MRYHYKKPAIYLSMYGERYICEHPVYSSCTLFKIGEKGLAVIQQRFDAETKSPCISHEPLAFSLQNSFFVR